MLSFSSRQPVILCMYPFVSPVFQESTLIHDLDTFMDLYYFHELVIFCGNVSVDFKILPVGAESLGNQILKQICLARKS